MIWRALGFITDHKLGRSSTLAWACLFLTGCGSSSTENNISSKKINNDSILYLNDKQIMRLVVDRMVIDQKGGPYDQGISFYSNGKAYILNNSGQNISPYEIKKGVLCLRDFVLVCSRFALKNNKFLKIYTNKEISSEVEIEIRPIATRRLK